MTRDAIGKTHGPVYVDENGNLLTAPGPFTTVLEIWKITVPSDAGGKTLEDLKGSPLSADLKLISIIQEDDSETINVAKGTASASSPRWPKNGLGLPIDKDLADDMKFFSAAGADALVVELG